MNHKAGSLLQRRGRLAVVAACALASPLPVWAKQVLIAPRRSFRAVVAPVDQWSHS